MKHLWKITVAALLLVGAGWVTTIVLANWFAPPIEFTYCSGASGGVPATDPSFRECLEKQAKLYLEKDYAESKDLAKTFLTLISAMLVASITFSEKIVDVSKAELLPLSTMIVCWVLLIVALVACGVGLALMTTAAGMVAYQPQLNFREMELRGVNLFLGSGVAFIFALVALVVAGVASLFEKRKYAKSVAAGAILQPSPIHDGRA
jgi:hypothetical protein